MRFARLLAIVVLLGTAGTALAQDYVRVERRRSTAGIILRDTIAGGLLGSAVAGGVILYEMGIENHQDYDWGRTLAWGAIAGLAAGLVFGVVDAADEPNYAMVRRAPMHDGMSMTLDVRRSDQSGTLRFPLLQRRF